MSFAGQIYQIVVRTARHPSHSYQGRGELVLEALQWRRSHADVAYGDVARKTKITQISIGTKEKKTTHTPLSLSPSIQKQKQKKKLYY